MIRTLIIDDEPLARRALIRFLRFHKDVEIIGECGDGASAITASRILFPDLLFLDIRMPEKDGFEVVSALANDRAPAVVFISAYDQHAIRAFEVHAVDYLLKPFSGSRLSKALDHVRERTNRAIDTNALELLLAETRRQSKITPHSSRFPVMQNGRIRLLPASDIEHIEAMGNYARLHTRAASFEIRETMQTLENKLDPAQFVRIHRSSIVNLDFVQEIQPWFAGGYSVVLKDGTKLRLSRYQRDAIQRLTGRRMAREQ
jgi:two-component system LytT family response regulator